jgi:membrane protease YdiL (CAAX protease family)
MAEITFLILIFMPLLLVLWFANLADKAREAPQPIFAFLAYLLLILFWVALLLSGMTSVVAGRMFSALSEGGAGDPAAPMPFPPETLGQIGLALIVPALLGLLVLLPYVRRFLAHFIKIDPTRTVHAVALSYMLLILVNLWVTLAIGLDALADTLAADPGMTTNALVGVTWTQDLLLVLMAFIGVGWLVRRDWRRSLSRLGLVLPTWRQIVMSLVLAGVFVAALILMEWLFARFGIGFDEDVERVTEQIVGPLMMTIPGILTLGLAAALGEELVFRGALQPRFGLVLTAILFALIHSNYGITLSTAVVLVLGLVLGWQRIRYNTSSAMITHATYNIVLGLMSFLNLWPEW